MVQFRRRNRTEEADRTESVGVVSAPSGDLLLFDFGLLRLWSGDNEPLLDATALPVDVVERANSFADFEIVGPDAAAVAAELNLAAVKGRFAFDMPSDGDLITERVRCACGSSGWQASVRRIDRMPHRQRLLRLLDDNPNGVEVPFHGMWGVAVRGIPRDRALPVRGLRMDANGPDAGRWRSVWVELTQTQPDHSVEAGYVLVEEARLMFADPIALNSWRSDDPSDGLADVAFWGRDAAAVAAQLGAGVIESPNEHDIFGWSDRPVAEALEFGDRLSEVRQAPDLKFAMDFRPHDDHYRLLTVARRSATESATIDVAGIQVTGFFTTWGDGAFPVFRDIGADGRTCRIRVELAAT